jgi:CubicO group peptidase (beta-lactamase class C family)
MACETGAIMRYQKTRQARAEPAAGRFLARRLRTVAIAFLILGAIGCGGSSDKPPSDKPAKPGDVSALTLQGLPVTIPLPGQSGGSGLTYSLAAQPAHGTAVMAGGAVTYSPAGDFAGEDAFTFTATDGKGRSEPATVRVSVLPVTGPVVPGGSALDMKIRDLLAVPDGGAFTRGGLSVAVAHNGQLVFARAYGWADPATGRPFEPDSLSRLASVSKVITMLVVMQLVEQGTLSLDDHFLDHLPGRTPQDARMTNVTLRQLLSHTAGMPPMGDGDPTFEQIAIRTALGLDRPPTCAEVLDWTLAHRALGFDPGTQYEYSNVGFCALAAVVEASTGEEFQVRARNQVLAPLGIHDARYGGSREVDLLANEVHYVESLTPTCPSVFDGSVVPCPYAFSVTAREGSASWIASAVDLTRLGSALGSALLSPGSWAQVTQCGLPGEDPTKECYGLGLLLYLNGTSLEFGHVGQSFATHTQVWRLPGGWTYGIVNNTGHNYMGEAWPAVEDAIHAGVFTGPDLYLDFPSPDLGPYSGP